MPKTKKELGDEEKSLLSILTICGITDKEAKLYWILLNSGQVPAAELIKKSGLKKGNTYALLNNLKLKGLVTSFMKDKKAYFQAEPPQRVFELLQFKLEQTNQAKLFLDQLLPKLSSRYKMGVGKPIVQYYEGQEGVQKMYEDVYSPKNEPVYGAADVDKPGVVYPEYVIKKLVPQRVKNKLLVKSFFNDSATAQLLLTKDEKEYRESVVLDKDRYPLPAEINVYEDKIAIMCFREGNFIGVMIEQEEMATTVKSILKALHDKLYKK